MATIANEYQRLLDFPGGSVVKKIHPQCRRQRRGLELLGV